MTTEKSLIRKTRSDFASDGNVREKHVLFSGSEVSPDSQQNVIDCQLTSSMSSLASLRS